MSKISAYSEALNMFLTGNPGEMAAKSGSEYIEENNKLKVKYFNKDYFVDTKSGNIESPEDKNVSRNSRTLILQYLINACGLEPRGNWLSFIQLPDGPHHEAPFKFEAVEPLARDFGNKPREFIERIKELGGKEEKIGDYGAIIYAFPRLPMACCIWEGDDEFPPAANILFDAVAPLYLSTAALYVLGIEMANLIRGVKGRDY